MSIVIGDPLPGMVIMHHYQPLYCDLGSREVMTRLSHIASDCVPLLERIDSATEAEEIQGVRNLINLYLFDQGEVVDYSLIADAILELLEAHGIIFYLAAEHVFSQGACYGDYQRFADLAFDPGL